MLMPDDLLPFSQDIERAVLGSVLVDNAVIHQIRTILPQAGMFHPKHQPIYQAMLDLADKNVPPDYEAVCDLLDKRKQLKNAGGRAEIALFINSGTSIHAEHYAGIVERDYVRREAMNLGSRITNAAFDAEDVNDLLAEINAGVMALEGRRNGGGPRPIADAVSELYDNLQEWQSDLLPPGQVRGLSTGLLEFDKMMGGMEKGESLVIIAGRPRVGKSALSVASAFEIAKQGGKVLIFALEMKDTSLVARIASAASGVNYKQVRRGAKEGTDGWYASPEDFSKFTKHVLELSHANNLYIDHTQNLTISQIRSRSMVLSRKLGGLDLIVVDTGNLVQSENVRGKNFAQVESDKVRGIRNLIKEIDCVAYVTWQLNKGVDSRPSSGLGRMPTLGDLRDTGGVEEHASDVIGLYRDELYNPETIEFKNIMHLIGLKRRNDMGGTIQLIGYNPHLQKFYSPERKEIPF